jgi:hypothetical protein
MTQRKGLAAESGASRPITTTETTLRRYQAVGDARLMRILFGDRRQYHDLPARSARAKITIERTRPWESGRIGAIEKQIWLKMTVGRSPAWGRKVEFTTAELARLIYADPLLHKLVGKGEAPPKLKSWQYERIRRAAPTFADRVGRSTSKGRPWLWRLRDQYFHEVRKKKTARDAIRRKQL